MTSCSDADSQVISRQQAPITHSYLLSKPGFYIGGFRGWGDVGQGYETGYCLSSSPLTPRPQLRFDSSDVCTCIGDSRPSGCKLLGVRQQDKKTSPGTK
ncbi:hypothetical protein ElyMa_001394100 [Elysia marginata]|uniref:Uncharacterized protein n=1 Tax=Elysia marginata TaxID=1093978 RepID=A0AAV4IXV8_9GAST|nr:hypothetical protein ElyMa_001394100 [Elysia marginata]